MALQSEGLYHAVLAISATILRLADPKYNVAALEHRQKALENLISVLNRGNWDDQAIDEALGLVLVLCWFQISDSCSPSWVTHLDGLWRLLRRRQGSSTRLSSHSEKLSHFFHRYFAFHLVLAKTTFHVDDFVHLSDLETALAITSSALDSGQHPPLHVQSQDSINPPTRGLSEFTDLLPLGEPTDPNHIIDPYMGFSNALLLLINEVADLAWQQLPSEHEPTQTANDTYQQLQTTVSRLKADLENLRQIPPPGLTTGQDFPTLGLFSPNDCSYSEIATIAETYRLGALLLLYEICSTTSQSTRNLGMLRSSHRIPHLPAEDKQRYVREILRLLCQNSTAIVRTASMPLWALFLAGCCATADEERITVLEIFERAESRKRYGNITPAREVVEMVWRQSDLAAQDERKRHKSRAIPVTGLDSTSFHNGSTRPGELQRTKKFEWERAMAMLGGWKLSLT